MPRILSPGSARTKKPDRHRKRNQLNTPSSACAKVLSDRVRPYHLRDVNSCLDGVHVGTGWATISPMSAEEKTNHQTGCLVCGATLDYAAPELAGLACHYCGQLAAEQVRCEQGHHVCDTCHQGDATAVIEAACQQASAPEMAPLLQRLRQHPSVKIHGPEHHALVPGVILANYRTLGGELSPEVLGRAVRRGAKVPGGNCGFWGACGAGSGVGLAFGAILGSSPVKGEQRGLINEVTSRVLARIAGLRAPRCCHRDSMVSIQAAAEFSPEYLDLTLQYGEAAPCDQVEKNKECIRERCPLYPTA